jgi:hypothetical protein
MSCRLWLCWKFVGLELSIYSVLSIVGMKAILPQEHPPHNSGYGEKAHFGRNSAEK